jgi:hypothetical protein
MVAKTAVWMDGTFLMDTAHQEEEPEHVKRRDCELSHRDRHAVSQILRKPQRLAVGRADGLRDDVGRRVDEDLPQEITGDCPGEGGDSPPSASTRSRDGCEHFGHVDDQVMSGKFLGGQAFFRKLVQLDHSHGSVCLAVEIVTLAL